jgi:hypothetical protein
LGALSSDDSHRNMFLAATARTGDAPSFSVTSTSRQLTGPAA